MNAPKKEEASKTKYKLCCCVFHFHGSNCWLAIHADPLYSPFSCLSTKKCRAAISSPAFKYLCEVLELLYFFANHPGQADQADTEQEHGGGFGDGVWIFRWRNIKSKILFTIAAYRIRIILEYLNTTEICS